MKKQTTKNLDELITDERIMLSLIMSKVYWEKHLNTMSKIVARDFAM